MCDIFDIDASQVTFSGKVDVTVAYDELVIQEPASELDARFLHYDGNGWQDITISVDTGANIVTEGYLHYRQLLQLYLLTVPLLQHILS